MGKTKEGIYHRKQPVRVDVVMSEGMVVYIEIDKPGRLIRTMSTERFLEIYEPADKKDEEPEKNASMWKHCTCGECLWIRRRVTGAADVP